MNTAMFKTSTMIERDQLIPRGNASSFKTSLKDSVRLYSQSLNTEYFVSTSIQKGVLLDARRLPGGGLS